MTRFTAEQIAPLVWYVYDPRGGIVAILDDSHADTPRDEWTMLDQARRMAEALNRDRPIFVLTNSYGPVAVYDEEQLAANVLCDVEDEEDQQNNSIEEFTLNQDPDRSELLA